MLIVVGVDASGHGEAAACRALELATQLQADLDVVHVLHIPGTVYAALSGVPDPTTEIGRLEREAVWERIGPVIEGSAARRIELDGYPPDALAEYAEAHDADLLIVGSRGRGALATLVLGSTSHRLIHLAPCDILVVKEEQP